MKGFLRAHKSDELINSSLTKLFGVEWENNKELEGVLAIIYERKCTPAHRIFLIQSSGFSPTYRALLSNINSGITFGKFQYSSTNVDYLEVLDVINSARKASGNEPIQSEKSNGKNIQKRVSETLAIIDS